MLKLNNENYFSAEAQKQYMSVSQFKSFSRCEAAAFAELTGDYTREETIPLLVGSYVDACFEGSIDKFISEHPYIFKRDGTLKSEYIQADKIVNRIRADKMMSDFLDGEKQVIMTGEINDVPIKIKIDAYHPDKMIVDLKVMRDFQPIYVPEQGRLSWIEAWRYDLQGAVYQEIVRQNTGKQLPFYLVAATKEKEPDIGIFQVSQELLDFELEHFKEEVVTFEYIKQGIISPSRCNKCDYCKATKQITEIIKMEDLYND